MANQTSLGFTIFARNLAKKALKQVSNDLDTVEKRISGVGRVARKGAGLAVLAGGATALAQAIVPATAAIAAMPAVMAGAKVATGVLKVGLIGVGEAMSAVAEGDTEALNKALKDLSPNARAFVKETAGLKKSFDPVQKAVQNKLFAGLSTQMGPVAKNLLPTVRKGMTGVASSLNLGAREALKFGATPFAKGAVAKVFGTTERIMARLGTAVQPALKALTALTVGSLPLAERMTKWATGGIKAAAAFVTSERGATMLRNAVQTAGDTLAKLGRIGKNVVTGLVGVFSQAKGFGGDLLGTIEQLTGKFATWAQSADGQQRVAEVFGILGDTARQVAGVLPILLGPLGAVAKILTSLPEPVRGAVTQVLAFSVVAGGLAGKLVPLGAGLVGAGKGLVSFGSGLVKGSAGLAANAGGAAKAGAAVRSFAGFLGRGIAASAQMVVQLSALAWQGGKVAVQMALAAGKQALLTGAQIAGNVASKALAAGTWLVNAAMKANPIGLVVTVLTALVGGLVLAYNKSETFRKIVQGAWSGIQAAVSWAWTNVLKPVFGLIVGYYTTLGKAALWLWNNGVKPAWNLISTGIRVSWSQYIQPVFSFLATTITKTIPGAFKSGVAAIGRFWGKVQDVAKKPVAFVVNTIYNKGIARVWNWVAGKVGLPELPEIKGFATGGRIRQGSGPTADDVLIAASRDEFMVNAASTRANLGLIDYINRRGRNRDVLKDLQLAGDPGRLGIPGYAEGGLIGWVKGFISKGKNFFLEGFQKAARAALDPMIGLADRTIGQTTFGKAMVGLVRNTVNGVLSRFAPLESELGGGPGRKAVAAARSQIGTPYSWGGGGWSGPSFGIGRGAGTRGFDCSGLMQYAWYKAAGKITPRTTYSMLPWMKSITRPVPGALWFPHSGHVGMISDRPGKMIEAPYTGARVREVPQRGTWRLGMPPWKFDDGGILPPGPSLVYNDLGRPEPLGNLDKLGGRGEVLVRLSTDGVYDEMLRLIRRIVRVEGRGNVQVAFGSGRG